MGKPASFGYAPVNGISMYYELYGSKGMPLVLIHGGGSTIESTFGTLLPLLSGCGKLVAVELQAHGRTSDRDAPESFEQDADDVAALLDYLKVGRANIFGFSNGGTTALHLASRHPQLVNKLIVASAAYQREGFIPGFFESMNHATIDNMPESLKVAYRNVAPRKENLHVMFEKDRDRMIAFTDLSDEWLKSIGAPALVMSADHDVVTPEHAVKIARLLPDSQLVILPGTHGAFLGEAGMTVPGSKLPEVTAMIVEEFLNSR